MNSGMHILFHRPTAWDSHLNCSTKTYARLFSESGYRVTYLQGTINPAHRILRRGYYSTWKKGSRLEQEIWVTGGFSLIPYLDNSRFLARVTGRLSYLTCIPSIRSLVYDSGYGAPDIIWTTIPGSTTLGKIFPKARLFFHAVDNYSAYRGKGATALEAIDYAEADYIFVIGQALSCHLQKKFQIPDEKITNLGQGVAIEKYRGNFSIPTEILGLPKPIAVWVGLMKKVDVEFLQIAAKSVAEMGGSTILIGPGFDLIAKHFRDMKEVVYLGSKSHEEIPDYLRSCDLGLMLYDRKKSKLYEHQHPLKLYEYAAAGLPTLATPHAEFTYLSPPILEVESAEDVTSALRQAVLNASRFRDAMLEFASEHTWVACKQKAEEIFNRLDV